MATLNKVMSDWSTDSTIRKHGAFRPAAMVVKFGFAVTNRRKNAQTGQWETTRTDVHRL